MKKDIKIAVASGKGGTGKTLVATNLAYLLSKNKKYQLFDCDVEAPDSIIFFSSTQKILEKNANIMIPEINPDKCTYCGLCADYCEFNAIVIVSQIKKAIVSEDLCHGCGLCSYICPVNAITEKEKPIGKITQFRINNLVIKEGRLNISESTPSPVIRSLKKEIEPDNPAIYDAPPGTSCSVIHTIHDVDFVILVAEASPFGFYDMKLSIEVFKKLNKKFGVIINKSGEYTDKIKEYLKQENIKIFTEIPYDKEIAHLYSEGKLIVKELPHYKEKFMELITEIERMLQ